MAVELATAWVNLVPSTKGIARQVRNEVGRPLENVATEAGTRAGRGFGSNLVSNTVSSLDRLGGNIVGALTTGLKVGVAAGGAIIAGGLFGGLQRALDREDAVVTFRRLGLGDENIEQLTSGINDALAGTPIGNPEGFALAGRFLAQGFDEADIPGVVGTIADMATVGNRSFSEMADVLVTAAGQGRITAAELNRLGDVPIGRVAEELGMTESELRDMVSAGELTAEAFIEAFSSVEEFNGAAQDPTTRTAFKNLRTAVSNLGEKFLGPLLGEGGVAQRAMIGLRDAVDSIGPIVTRLGEQFANWLIPAVGSVVAFFTQSVIPAFQAVARWVDENRAVIGRVVAAIIPAIGIVAGFAVSINLLKTAWMLLRAATPIGLLTLLVGALVYAWQNSETFREVVTAVFEAVSEVISTVIDTVVGLVQGFGQSTEDTGSWLADTWAQIQDVFQSAAEAIVGIIRWGTSILTKFWERFGTHIIQFAKGTWENIKQLIDAALRVIRGIFDVFAGIFTGDWSRVWEGIKAIFSGIWSAIHALLSQAVENLKLVLGGALAAISQLWEAAWNTVKTLARNAWDAVVGIFREKIEDAKSEVRAIKDFVVTFFSGAKDWLLNAGKNIVQGLIDGIGSMVGAVGRAVNRVVTSVTDRLPWSPAKKGPFSKRPPEQAGRNITELLAEGMGDKLGLLQKMSNEMASAISPEVDIPTVNVPSSVSSGRVVGDDGASLAEAGARTVEQNFYGPVNDDITGRSVSLALRMV